MTSTLSAPIVTQRTSLRTLCMLEAKGYLRRASIWIGLAVSVATTVTVVLATVSEDEDWSGGAYESSIPAGFIPITLGVLIAAIRTGGRDRSPDLPELAEEAPFGAEQRTIARLVGLVTPVALCCLGVVGIAILSRIEGGFWIGDAPRRTDTALHHFVELLQPPLLVAFVGAAGVAAGRAGRRTAVPLIVGFVVWFVLFTVYWAWNSPGLHVFALLQTQPMSVDLPVDTDPNTLPADWLVDDPGQWSSWQRQFVHLPTVVWHNVYLVGLIVVSSGLALRGGSARRLVTAGAVLAAAGVIAQTLVSPY